VELLVVLKHSFLCDNYMGIDADWRQLVVWMCMYDDMCLFYDQFSVVMD